MGSRNLGHIPAFLTYTSLLNIFTCPLPWYLGLCGSPRALLQRGRILHALKLSSLLPDFELLETACLDFEPSKCKNKCLVTLTEKFFGIPFIICKTRKYNDISGFQA